MGGGKELDNVEVVTVIAEIASSSSYAQGV
jgi:hypothetical protein